MAPSAASNWQLVERLADAAGQVIRPHFRRLDAIELKADATPVTVADKAAELAMRELLARERPADGILGEEFEPVACTSGWLWVLDPIDGTKAFTAGKPLFTTLIALVEEDRPRLGCIDQPFLRERWIGDGQNATFGGREVVRKTPPPLERAVLSSTAPEMFQDEADRAAVARLQRATAYTSWGGDAYAYGLLALGSIDIVVEAGLKPFDLAPLAPIIEAVGGKVTDWQGRPLSLASDGRILAAGSALLHEQALKALNG